MFKRRILIVEDDAFVGALLRESLTGRGFLCEVAVSAVDAKQIITKFDPDVALVDINLGVGPSGIELVEYLAQARPEIAPMLLTQRASVVNASHLPENVAFLRKGMLSDTDYLVDAIEETVRGRGSAIKHQAEDHELAQLSKTQLEVLRLIALGYTNAEIAKERGTTISGAEQSVSTVFKALGLNEPNPLVPRVEAARRYIRAQGFPERGDQ